MPTYLMRTFMKTVGSGRIDPASLSILAVAGGWALVEYLSKKLD